MATIGSGPPAPAHKIAGISVSFICVAAVFQSISIVAVVFRFLSRRLVNATGWDDWASLAALIFSFGNTAGIIFPSVLGRGGYHEPSLTYAQLGIFLEGVLVYNVTLICSTTCAKIALLWFYRRAFPVGAMRIRVWTFIALTLVAYWLVGCCLIIFSNDPVESQWKPWIIPRRTLGVKYVFGYICIADMIVDIGILCLPQKQVWKLHASRRRRLLVSTLFLLGILTCAMTIVRFAYVIVTGTDYTYEIVRAGPWGTVEVHLSIIVGCAPMFPKLFRHWFTSRVQPVPDAASAGTRTKRLSLQNRWHDAVFRRPTESLPDITFVTSEQAKNAVFVQVDLEIDHIERSTDDEESDPSREYGWVPMR